VVFPDAEDSNWNFDEVAGKWYLHRFYSHMPDLNIANPRVREEISKVVGYWLELGLSGFRVDAAPFVIELEGTDHKRGEDPHAYLRDLRAFSNRRRGDAILLAEANLPPDDQRRFFEAEREEVFAALAPDPDMRSFGRGIRRRVPPMLDGDRRRIELLYSLLFTLPGTPVLLYGEEIGLGDDQRVEGRAAVRVAMQWTAGPAAGFTTGDPAVPLVTEGPFAPEKVNVADQRRDPESLLNWMERAIRARKELPELGWGTWKVLDTDQPSVLALRCDWLGQGVLVLHNLGPEAVRVAVQLDDAKPGRLLAEVLANRRDDPVEAGRPLALDGYGYRWLRLPPAEPG
jgi:maltose alpha-D-glucosyltransferase/alpha-amylase